MGLIKKSLCLLVLAAVVRQVYRISLVLGFHRTVYNHFPGPCHLVPGIVNGSEDVYIMSDGLAIISSGWCLHEPGLREGALYLLDLNDLDSKVKRLHTGDLQLHSPHGLSVYEDQANGEVTLLVVQHPPGGDTVEKFEFDRSSRTLKHMRTIRDQAFLLLNGIVATSSDTFYATNSHTSHNAFITMVEFFLVTHTSSVVYYDGLNANFVADGFAVANGINISPNGRFVYVASSSDLALRIFTRHPDNSLSDKETYMLHTVPDNIKVDRSTGDLWIAGQPRFYRIIAHISNPDTDNAPSQVLRLRMREDGASVETIEEILAEDGNQVSLSSTAVYHQRSLLVGTVYHKLLHCEVLHLE